MLVNLPLQEDNRARAVEELLLYIHAVISKYLLMYQQQPDAFFARADAIQAEVRAYLDLMLKGVCREVMA